MNHFVNRLCRLTLVSIFVGSVCCLTTGCEDLTGAAMEKAIDATSEGSLKRASFAGRLRKLKEDCPIQINDYTTLEEVKMKGINRVEFRYLVSESGREIVHMHNWMNLDPEILKRTAESPLADSVMALDIGIEHVFKDSDNIQMYSKRINKSDLKRAKRNAELAEKRKIAEEKMAELAANQPEPAPSNGRAITITTLEEHSRQQRQQVTKPVYAADDASTKMKTSHVSTDGSVWIPKKFDGFRQGKANPAGVQSNPYGSAPTQGNPYAQ
jgi:hypothetical protein